MTEARPDTTDHTFELRLRFVSTDSRLACATKVTALALLRQLRFTDVVEGVVDGVDDLVDDAPTAQLWAQSTSDSTPVLVYHQREAALRDLAHKLAARFPGLVETRLGRLSVQSWQQAWDDQAEHELATERFCLQAAGSLPAPGELRLPLILGPGAAFGDGRHATTMAALKALERLCDSHPRGATLDIGTGTGVLAIAAARLGFAPLVATEIEASALTEAAANAALNGLTLELHLGAALPAAPAAHYQLILANILVPVLHQLMPVMAASLAPRGSLILAGFIELEAGPLISAARAYGLVVLDQTEARGWVGLRLGWPL